MNHDFDLKSLIESWRIAICLRAESSLRMMEPRNVRVLMWSCAATGGIPINRSIALLATLSEKFWSCRTSCLKYTSKTLQLRVSQDHILESK